MLPRAARLAVRLSGVPPAPHLARTLNAASVSVSVSVRHMSATSKAQNANNANANNAKDKSDDGMDLFARALAAQKAKAEAAKKAASDSAASASASSSSTQQQQPNQKEKEKEKDEDLDEEVSPEEEERRRRWKEQADEAERKRIAKGSKGVGALAVAALVGAYVYMGLATEDDKEPGFSGHHNRVRKFLHLGAKSVVEPPSVKLLPDPLPEPYQRPYTLCLELNDSLVHLVWDKDNGWRVATRPGVKQFISYLSRYFEVVIFTTSLNHVAQPVIETLDPYHYIMYSLYRDSTRLMGIKHVKDLSCLNRDLGKIIVVDTDPENFQLQPENGIELKAWKGEEGDEELSKLMKLLEEMALLATIVNLNDLRPLLKSFKSLSTTPNDLWSGWLARKEQLRADFAESDRRQRGVTSTDEIAAAADAKPSSSLSSVVGNFVGALFGRGISNPQQQGPAAQPGSNVSGGSLKRTNLIDLIEHAAKEEYAMFLKEQKEQVKQMEEAKKKHEEEQMAQLQAMKDKKLKLFDYMMGAGNPEAPGAPGTAAPAPATAAQ